MKTIDLYIGPDGTIQGVYDDALVGLFEGEKLDVRRASHVEPDPRGGWTADMRPVGGPVLGETMPFATRSAALEAERAWLDRELATGRRL